MSVGFSGVNHLIGHILMMQMDSFTFRVLIRYLELISVPNQSKIKLFYKIRNFILVLGDC